MSICNLVKYCIPLLLLVLYHTNTATGQSIVDSYVLKYQELAIKMMHESGIPASIILSIAITESAAGTSRNARLLHNHFGIKAKKRYRIPGTKSVTAYKTYDSDTLSYRAFCDWISHRGFYQDLCENNDYKLWLKKLGLAGYARARTAWKKKLLVFIEKYCLSDLDCMISKNTVNQ